MGANNWQVYFYKSKTGKQPVKDYINNLSTEDQAKVRNKLKLLKEFGPFNLDISHVKYLKDKIWELRIVGKNQHRIFWFIFNNKNIILLHAFHKKSHKIPLIHIQQSTKRKNDFIKRYGGE